jgi:hypothetical protein
LDGSDRSPPVRACEAAASENKANGAEPRTLTEIFNK